MQINITEKQRERASKFLTFTGDKEIDDQLIAQLELSRQHAVAGKSDDFISMTLPQAYEYRFQVSLNAQALQHFFNLRGGCDSHAHYDINALANAMFDCLPEDHKFLFSHCIS